MRYRTLGRTGIKVSPYALGALALGTSIGNPRVIGSAGGRLGRRSPAGEHLQTVLRAYRHGSGRRPG